MSSKSKKHVNVNSEDINTKILKNNHVSVNDYYLKSEFIDGFYKAVSQKIDTDFENGAHYFGQPFSCAVFPNFLNSFQFVEDLKMELGQVEMHKKDSDLFRFKQSDDLATSSLPTVNKLINILYKDCLPWLEKLTGFSLTDEVDMTCSTYDYTEVLLCHDDMLKGRRIAFIYYLVPDWDKDDGGTLDIFKADNGNATTIVRSLIPSCNNFVFFEVSPASFHQVSEVLKRKTRLSINGWFHSVSYGTKLVPEQENIAISFPRLLANDDITCWINPLYLEPESIVQIRNDFSETSEIELPNFLRDDKYRLVADALNCNSIDWDVAGPRNKRYFHEGSNLPSILKKCLNVLHSEEICLILSNLTGLVLHPSAESDSSSSSSSSDSETENANDSAKKLKNHGSHQMATYTSLVRKWSPGCYTLLDDSLFNGKAELDSILYFNCDEWNSEYGGFTSYVAKGETDELLRIEPKSNSLALIYTDEKTAGFVKYINKRAFSEQNSSVYYDISTTFYEQK